MRRDADSPIDRMLGWSIGIQKGPLSRRPLRLATIIDSLDCRSDSLFKFELRRPVHVDPVFAPFSFSSLSFSLAGLSAARNSTSLLPSIPSSTKSTPAISLPPSQALTASSRSIPNILSAISSKSEALWWKIWCTSAEFKYGMSYPRHRAKLPADQHYLDLAAKASALAEAQIALHDTADMQFYAGMGDALLRTPLRPARRNPQRRARRRPRSRTSPPRRWRSTPTSPTPTSASASTTITPTRYPALARVLRFFMGIPGGSKQEGIRQLERAIDEGALTPPEARFYLAISLHNYDQKYEQALESPGRLRKNIRRIRSSTSSAAISTPSSGAGH